MQHPILSLHHVTATVDDAQQDLDFCSGILALRLLKQTVNFDNHNVYHFYYGDEVGTPGTIWTTFPYRGWQVPVGAKGVGQVTITSFSVPRESLDFWRARLAAHSIVLTERTSPFGEPVLGFDDPSGLRFELVGCNHDPRTPWAGNGVDLARAIRGLHGVTLEVSDPSPTVALMTDLLGFRVAGESDGLLRVAVHGDAPGHRVDIAYAGSRRTAKNGIGTVHHVALAIDTADEQLRLREELVRRGISVTPVLDRQYFQSIYFREPGGVLFEVATSHPGFTVDESLAELGRGLKLPVGQEPNRATIEGGLPPIVTR